METTGQSRHSVRFKTFELNLLTRELHRNGRVIKLHGRPIEVLAILLERHGELVTREELRKKLWPKGTYVDFEQILNNSVRMLREALGDKAESPQYIETLPRLGYRFIAPVDADAVEAAAPAPAIRDEGTLSAPAEPSDQLATSNRWMVWVVAGVFAAVLGSGIWFYLHLPLPPPSIAEPVRLTLDGRRKNVVGTDGSRLYLNLEEGLYSQGVAQVPVNGGQITEIPIDLPTKGGNWGISSVSPDGSSLLVFDHLDTLEGAKISIVGILGHPVRYLTQSYPAVWSPDGKSALYATPRGDIYSMQAEGGEPRLILASPAPNSEGVRTDGLSWSPDGSTIRFTTRNDKIWEVSSNGSNLHQLLPGWHGSALQWGGQWTPDGNFYLFLSGSTLSRHLNFRPGGQLWAIDERRGRLRPPIREPIQLTSDPMLWGRPVPARNGHTIFARGISLRGELVRFDKRSNHLDPYLRGISAEMVVYSRDGRYLAYVTFPDGILWRANRDGGELLQLTKPPFYPRDVRWSPDGLQLAFTDNSQSGVDAVYAVPSQGGTPQRLIPEEGGPHVDLTWSPDGKKVVYSTTPWMSVGNWSQAKVETRILDLATRQIITLPHRPEGFWSTRWSPDGRYIAGLPINMDNLTIFDLKTQRFKDVLRKGLNGFPCWSKDGRFIYFVRSTEDRGIYRIPVTGGDEERIVSLKDFRSAGWYGSWMGLDPDDTPLILRDAGTNEIYAFTLESK